MVEVIYYVATSLDGYIATSDGGVEWLGQFRASEDDDSAGEFYASVDALLLGSHTYEFALKLGRWPSPDKPSWVFTSRRLRLLDPSITLTSQSPGEVIELLGSQQICVPKVGDFHHPLAAVYRLEVLAAVQALAQATSQGQSTSHGWSS